MREKHHENIHSIDDYDQKSNKIDIEPKIESNQIKSKRNHQDVDKQIRHEGISHLLDGFVYN